MKEFLLCRRDKLWGERSLHQLIEIFLNPGNETIGGEALSPTVNGDSNTDQDSIGIMTADKFIKVFIS